MCEVTSSRRDQFFQIMQERFVIVSFTDISFFYPILKSSSQITSPPKTGHLSPSPFLGPKIVEKSKFLFYAPSMVVIDILPHNMLSKGAFENFIPGVAK